MNGEKDEKNETKLLPEYKFIQILRNIKGEGFSCLFNVKLLCECKIAM